MFYFYEIQKQKYIQYIYINSQKHGGVTSSSTELNLEIT